MTKICHKCRGHDSDNYNLEADLKRCFGYKTVYYCSTACQKGDWIEHIFHCKPRRPINTADYLARAVHRDEFPEHSQTSKDYGFDRVRLHEERLNLLGLYTVLIKTMEIPPKTIHDWRTRGVLVDEIKAVFYRISEHSRDPCFLWFLQHEDVITQANHPLSYDDDIDALMLRSWRFIGGSERDSLKEISEALERKPDADRGCWFLYFLLLAEYRASPDFGFAACTSSREGMAVWILYRKLITACTFSEFCDAYRMGHLLDLFHSRGLQVDEHQDQFRDILEAPPRCKKSVWYLKQFVLHDTSIKADWSMRPAVAIDYGFINCKDSERRQLGRVYKAFFEKHQGDLLALHEAAMEGNLHRYLSSVVEGLRDPKFRRLMENPH